MKIKIKFFPPIRQLTGGWISWEDIKIENDSTLSDLIEKLALKYGKQTRRYLYQAEIDQSFHFLINKKDTGTLSGLKTKLREGDIVTIISIPSIGGG